MKCRVGIVGGGPGGVCAAMLLAKRGFDVTLLEKQATLGGRSGTLVVGDYKFDVGSTLLMMRFVAREMFELVDRNLEDEVTLTRLDPMYRLDFDSRTLDISSDHRKMASALRQFAPGSEAGFVRFLQKERVRLEHLYPVLQQVWPGLLSMASPLVMQALPHVGLGKSLHATASEYFDDKLLKLAFSFQAAYLGMSPWQCPGGFAMVPYVEHAWGIDYVHGGIAQLSLAMGRIAQELGAKIRTNTEVKRLVVEGERCVGLELHDGGRVLVDWAIVDADATASLPRLLGHDLSLGGVHHRLENTRESCSTTMFYWGLDTCLPLMHHTFFFARDYEAEMVNVFETGVLGDDVSVYVCNPSVTDKTLAPPGHSSLYALVLVPNTRANVDWAKESSRLRTQVVRLIERRTGLQVDRHIRAESMLTPTDWETTFGISHGAVFGPKHTFDQLLAFRLPNQLHRPSNVLLTGGGTSPGSGLPTILESARLATRLLCTSQGIDFPSSKPLPAEAAPFSEVV